MASSRGLIFPKRVVQLYSHPAPMELVLQFAGQPFNWIGNAWRLLMEPLSLPGLHEPVSSLSHLLGAVVFLGLAWAVIQRGRGDRLRIASLAIMALCTVQLLIFSSLYHMFPPGPLRLVLHQVDVSAIFLMTAGSMTPVHIILFKGAGRWAPLAIAWSAAVGGIIFRWTYADTVSTRGGIAIFLLFGWGAAITAAVLWQRHGWTFIRNGILSGLTYTAGAAIIASNQPTLVAGVIGPHELWHAAVLCAIGFYWRFVLQFASGEVPELIMPSRILGIPQSTEQPPKDASSLRRAA